MLFQYFAGQTSSLLRGTWFMENNWQPVPEGYADQIETEHLAKFENAKIDEDEIESLKGPLPGICYSRTSFERQLLLQTKSVFFKTGDHS